MSEKKRKPNRPPKPAKVVIKHAITAVFFGVMIAGMCFTMIYPIVKLLPNVFSSLLDLGNPDVIWIPVNRSTLSFTAAWRLTMKEGIMTIAKSVGYAGLITLIQIFISAMVGYAIARVNFPGANLIFVLVLFVFLVPPQALLLSQYIHFQNFWFLGKVYNLIGRPVTLYLLALVGFGVNQSLFIFVFRQFFKNTPKELEEAALIDGCGFNKTYFKVMLPNAKPAIATVAVLGFVWNYGDTYYTGYFDPDGPYLGYILNTTFQSANKQFVTNAIMTWSKLPLANAFAFDAVKQAGALLYMIPLLIFYFITQHWLVENVENAGIVG
ncbi:MAG: carbohydrate ABC transporter permease [Lachnospiraceae bacterium]|nr:carbohydrate ABC transporter permease [Lachnospiraceae bacterium]